MTTRVSRGIDAVHLSLYVWSVAETNQFCSGTRGRACRAMASDSGHELHAQFPLSGPGSHIHLNEAAVNLRHPVKATRQVCTRRGSGFKSEVGAALACRKLYDRASPPALPVAQRSHVQISSTDSQVRPRGRHLQPVHIGHRGRSCRSGGILIAMTVRHCRPFASSAVHCALATTS